MLRPKLLVPLLIASPSSSRLNYILDQGDLSRGVDLQQFPELERRHVVTCYRRIQLVYRRHVVDFESA